MGFATKRRAGGRVPMHCGPRPAPAQTPPLYPWWETVAGAGTQKTLPFDGRPIPWMPASAGMTIGAGLRRFLQGRAGRHDRGPG